MKITIIGASAGVGLEATKRALAREHQVTTLSRSILSLPPTSNLNCVQGDATKKEDLLKVIQNADAVIVALGTGKNMKATTLYSEASVALIEAQKELNTSIPFIILTGFGAGESGKFHKNFIMKLFFSLMLKDVYTNKTKMEELISKSLIKWEFVRPGILTDKPLTEKYRVETNYFKGMNIGSITRSDVADYLVKQAENPTELGKYPALSNK